MNGRGIRQTPIARERRHTLLFLDEIRACAPVFLDTEVDMTRIRAHQGAARRLGRRYSTVAYVLHAAGRVLAAHPEANSAIRGRISPRVASHQFAHGKLTFDKTMGGRRVVLSAVLRDLDLAELDDIQLRIDELRDSDPASSPEFAAARLLQRLPWPLSSLAFRLGVRPLGRRADSMGTFAVTSLAHWPVDGFHSVGGATITFGVGRTASRPVARDALVSIAPVMRLNLTFDHRMIDGAEAADVLAEMRDRLERWLAAPGADGPVPASAGTVVNPDGQRDE